MLTVELLQQIAVDHDYVLIGVEVINVPSGGIRAQDWRLTRKSVSSWSLPPLHQGRQGGPASIGMGGAGV